MLAGRPGVTPGQFKAPRHPRSPTASASRSPPRGSAHTPAHRAAAPLHVPVRPLCSVSSGLSGQGQNVPGTSCTPSERLCLGTRQRPAGPLLLQSPRRARGGWASCALEPAQRGGRGRGRGRAETSHLPPRGLRCPSLTLPTEGKPISATRASPDFMTSKPSPLDEDDLEGSRSWARYLASFAFSRPR